MILLPNTTRFQAAIHESRKVKTADNDDIGMEKASPADADSARPALTRAREFLATP